MNINKISKQYKCSLFNENHIQDIINLYKCNTLYFTHCPHIINDEFIISELNNLPPGIKKENKYFIGFYDENKLVGVMDLIDGYPDKDIIYIGLLMLDINIQGKGIGTMIINDLFNYLKELNYKEVQLGFVKTNPQASSFWKKLGFVQCRDEVDFIDYIVVPVKKEL